ADIEAAVEDTWLLIWRSNGLGELYLYHPELQSSNRVSFCNISPASYCNSNYGDSIGRGAFTIIPGQWNTVRQIITLNTPNSDDGSFAVYYGGSTTPCISFYNMNWRQTEDVGFIGIDFETFFGGNDPSWSTPTTQTMLFKGFVIKVLS
ncbi:hypothetical protein HK096_009430, partial [Nowakowskiella sp. JEL0078]